MATYSKNVNVYLSEELEAALTEYCLENNLTRKKVNASEEIPAMATGIVKILEQRLLNKPTEVLELVPVATLPAIPVARLPEVIIAPIPGQSHHRDRLTAIEAEIAKIKDYLRIS